MPANISGYTVNNYGVLPTECMGPTSWGHALAFVDCSDRFDQLGATRSILTKLENLGDG